jgi:hypothetical protein
MESVDKGLHFVTENVLIGEEKEVKPERGYITLKLERSTAKAPMRFHA